VRDWIVAHFVPDREHRFPIARDATAGRRGKERRNQEQLNGFRTHFRPTALCEH